jgi:hypothetical protein
MGGFLSTVNWKVEHKTQSDVSNCKSGDLTESLKNKHIVLLGVSDLSRI